MAQEDDLRALGKIMDFLRAVSIILAIIVKSKWFEKHNFPKRSIFAV